MIKKLIKIQKIIQLKKFWKPKKLMIKNYSYSKIKLILNKNMTKKNKKFHNKIYMKQQKI